MCNSSQQPVSLLNTEPRPGKSPLRISIGSSTHRTIVGLVVSGFLLMAALTQAQTFTVLHSFSGPDGGEPLSGVTLDSHGNLYGTAFFGGSGRGVVYKLTPHGSGWSFMPLHRFTGSDGGDPGAKVLVAPDGSLYGTTTSGGTYNGGVLYVLRPSPSRCPAYPCQWTATVLHNFSPSADGSYPLTINWDAAGNIVGAAPNTGPAGAGSVFKLTRSQGSWTFSVVTGFRGSGVGSVYGGVIADQSGNLYGAGYDRYPGSVFKVGTDGDVQILHQFSYSDGIDPFYGLVLDANGNLYGQAAFGGDGGGTIYELSPSGGAYSFSLLDLLPGGGFNGAIGSASMTLDSHGNLYGTTVANGAYNYGTVFKLSPSPNGWIYTDIYDFTGGADGCSPWSDVTIDSSGNLYGTTSQCGDNEGGTVWEITP